MTQFDPLYLTRIIVAVALIVQVVELASVCHSFADSGVWRWDDIRDEFKDAPDWIRSLADSILSFRSFTLLLGAELLAAVSMLFVFHPLPVVVCLFCSVATAVRWRGSFNGGSDYMTVVLLSALLVAALFPNQPNAVLGSIYYIAVVSCLSYFVAGLVKVRSHNWRNGNTLPVLVGSGVYGGSPAVYRLLQSRSIAILASWITICFELFFPFALFDRRACVGLIVLGAVFHLTNAYLLGLNRFLLVWMATYPTIYFVAYRLL
jgi:hypothetical protein